MKTMPAKEKIIVALDVPSADAALRVAQRLHGHVGMFKVGKEVFTAEGPAVVRNLVAEGNQVFLDLKFHDIPNTVRAAAQQAGMLGVSLLTVHASGRAQDDGGCRWRVSAPQHRQEAWRSPRGCWRSPP